MMHCKKCGRTACEQFETAYGDTLCEHCWDEYICTKEGKVEYMLGICRGDYPAAEFDDGFLKEVAASWKANADVLRTRVPAELFSKAFIKAEIFSKL